MTRYLQSPEHTLAHHCSGKVKGRGIDSHQPPSQNGLRQAPRASPVSYGRQDVCQRMSCKQQHPSLVMHVFKHAPLECVFGQTYSQGLWAGTVPGQEPDQFQDHHPCHLQAHQFGKVGLYLSVLCIWSMEYGVWSKWNLDGRYSYRQPQSRTCS